MKKICIVTPHVYGYGALLIGGLLEKYGANVVLKKTLDYNMPSVDMFGFSFHSVTDLLRSKRFVEAARKETGAFIVVGGSATFLPELVFKILPDVDIVVIGEGEEAVVDLVRYLEGEVQLHEVGGIAFRQGEEVVRTGKREPADLHGRPLPLMPRDLRYQNIRGGRVIQGANIYMETHRGCGASCTFCLVWRMFGRAIRSRPLNEIMSEAKAFKKVKAKRIALIGGTTSLYGQSEKSNSVPMFAKLLKSLSGIVGKPNLNAGDLRVDTIDSEVLDTIKKYTTGWISLGLESGSDRMLRKMNKKIDVSTIRQGVKLAKKHDVKTIGSFIAAYPEEEEEDFQATLELMQELQLDDYAVNIAEPIPGTPLFTTMISADASHNLFFQRSDKNIAGASKMTVAEYRATVLQKEAYETIFQRECPIHILERFLVRSKRECSRIKKIIDICRN